MKHLKTLMGLLVLLGALSCAKTQVSSEGALTFVISPAYELAEVTKSDVSEYTTLPDVSSFNLVITDAEGKETWSGLMSEWDPATKLPAGTYKAAASFGSLEEEGFDKPYFAGEKEFTIAGGETTEVSIEVTLANTIVKVGYNEMFKNYYKDYSVVLSRDNTTIAIFDKDESRAVFIDGYKLNVSGVFVNEVGTETSFSQEYTGLLSATAYTLQFDLSNVNGASVTIRFNNDVEEIPLGDFELNE